MLKLSDNPPILFPENILEEEQRDSWWVGHTKSRFEKAFAWELSKREVPFFLPMVERVTISGGKKRRGMQPLFPGYVFFRGTAETRYEALLTDRLCQVIEVPQQQTLIDELKSLNLVLGQKAMLDAKRSLQQASASPDSSSTPNEPDVSCVHDGSRVCIERRARRRGTHRWPGLRSAP
jgi:hypothetical protein